MSIMNTRRSLRCLLAAGLILSGAAAAVKANASVVVASTRVVYGAEDREVTLKLTNAGTDPALTQVWLDNGDPKAMPSSLEVPFLITPPIMRIEPGNAQTLRILHTGEPMPQGKESVYWLNMLEVPPNPGAEAADANTLQLAFRTRIKLFYRPAGLKGDARSAPAQVAWRLVKDGERYSLEARNPTPYHVTFAALELTGAGKTATFEEGGMVNPGETLQFPLEGEVAGGPGLRLHYHAINDYGGQLDGEAVPGL